MNEPNRGTGDNREQSKEEWKRKPGKTRRYPQLRVITGGNEDGEGWHQPPLALGPWPFERKHPIIILVSCAKNNKGK